LLTINDRDITAPTVLITGGASGIGAAVATLAADARARIAVLDIDESGARAVVDDALARGAVAALAIRADVRNEDEVEAAFARCGAELGTPTAVLANAGIELNGPSHEMPRGDWTSVLEVNLTGVFLTARHAIRRMLAAGVSGSIVCTSSPNAFVGFAGGGNAAYAASKGGISSMVRSLAIDYAPHGIRVNAVVPGATDTPIMLSGVPAQEQARIHAELVERARSEVPLGRMARPSEVAEAVVWLWSERASYMTGSHLVCDGGLLAKSANTF
jgi:NAD(P)-dependent dehydrogenase (short-subunit alcohol dehydrogenase family)